MADVATEQAAPAEPTTEAEAVQQKSRRSARSGSRAAPVGANGERLRSVGRWYIGETLGKGGYSWVKKGYDKKTGKPVALKFMTKADSSWAEEQTRQVITEIEALKQIRHRNVMKLYAYNLHAKYPTQTREKLDVILLVLEYAPGGELFDILYYTSALEEDIARTYFRQTIAGLEACHNAGVAHRDIKPQNLLLDSHFNLKLTDFGLSKVFESDADSVMHTSYVGTRGYQAPELLLNRPFDSACDIFSAGVVLFIILTGYPPFEQAHRKDRWYQPMINQDYRRFWKGHKHCAIEHNEPVKNLIQRMLEFDPNNRISMSEIQEHPWFNGAILQGKALISALRSRHQKMKNKRRNDLRKVQDLQHSVTQRRPIPGVEPDLPVPQFPAEEVELLKDIRTVTQPAEVRDQVYNVLCKYGASVEFDAVQYKLIAATKLRKTEDGQHSLVKFEIRFWQVGGTDQNIVRLRRLEGDPYDFFKVRQLVEKECNPVFVGDEDEVDEVDDEELYESEEDDYDAILAEDDDEYGAPIVA